MKKSTKTTALLQKGRGHSHREACGDEPGTNLNQRSFKKTPGQPDKDPNNAGYPAGDGKGPSGKGRGNDNPKKKKK